MAHLIEHQVWDFEFWSLGFVCYLLFVICDFNLNRHNNVEDLNYAFGEAVWH